VEFHVANVLRVRRYTEGQVPDQNAAHDIAQETWAAAWVRWQEGGRITSKWLFGVAKNKIKDYFRARYRAEDLEEAMTRAFEERTELDTFEKVALAEAMRTLEERDRQAIRLTYWGGYSASEVAVMLETSVANVWKILSRARKLLLAELREADAEAAAAVGGDTDAND